MVKSCYFVAKINYWICICKQFPIILYNFYEPKFTLSNPCRIPFFFIVATAVNAATYITIDGIRYVYNSTKIYVSVASVKSPSVYVGDVVIPEIITNTSGKVISVKAVKRSVFGDCTDVTSVTLPSSVTLIGDYAFEGNPQITEVYSCCANPPEIKKGYLDGDEIYTIFDDTDYSGRILYVPAGSMNAYKSQLGRDYFPEIKELFFCVIVL